VRSSPLAFSPSGVTTTFDGSGSGTATTNTGTVTFSRIEVFEGSAQADTFDATNATQGVTYIDSGGADVLQGSAFDDSFQGGANADNQSVDGQGGNDVIITGAGNDTLRGGAGDDTLTSGAGNDSIALDQGGGADVVTDFDMADTDGDGFTNDQIDVSALVNGTGGPVTARDVVVSDDGSGNALLTFPGGETLLLQGVAPSQLNTAAKLYSAGIPCLTAGTMVLTPTGEVPVEVLRPGDLVVTRDNGPQPLVWTGERRIDPATLAAHPALAPVRIGRGFAGCERGALVSPQHAVLLRRSAGATGRGGDEVLVRATHLARLRGGQVRLAHNVRDLRYVHLMFESHQIIYGNGLPSESFYPGPWGLALLDPAAQLSVARLLPDLARLGAAVAYGPPVRQVLAFSQLPPSLAELSAGVGFGPGNRTLGSRIKFGLRPKGRQSARTSAL